MQDDFTIRSHDKSLSKLFDDFYLVPDYQREYVWEEVQVEQLIEDIHAEFSSDNGHNREYFIGSIVVCLKPAGVFEMIDGQQRMTTAYLFLCAVRDHMNEHRLNAIQELEQKIATAGIDESGRDVFRYRVELQYEDSAEVLRRIAEGSDGLEQLPSTRSVVNIRNAYELLRAFLDREFATDEQSLRRFYSYFMTKVKLVRIEAPSVAHALKIFETINDRGIGLDSMDLLKNLMFMKAAPTEFDKLKREWKKLIDTLHKAREKPLRFLRYFIFATYDVDRLRQDEIYAWFVKNEERCGYENDPVGFVRTLLEVARDYVQFLKGKDASGQPNRYLENLRYLSGAARQHLILLLAARHLDTESMTQLCRNVENLFFAYLITREPTREFERKFAQWTSELRSVDNATDLEAFLSRRFEPELRELSERFDLALETLDAKSIQKYRMRYLIGKLAQHANELAYPGETGQTRLDAFINSALDIEHILPQRPSSGALQEFDKPDEADSWIQRLGNITLIEKTLNAALGNKPFSQKKEVYPRSKFLLTTTIGESARVGKNTAVDRAISELGLVPYESWTSREIADRQNRLRQIARKAWDIPEPSP